ncbi:MAG: hypothetical protein AB7S38_10730 [Vulcanimicrobiota bacterium]
MSKSANRAFSLLELLVASGLLLLLGTLFVWFLVPSVRYSSQGAARVDLEQMVTLALDRIGNDLQHTVARGVSYHPLAAAGASDPVVLAIVPQADVDADGRRIWSQEVVVYFWDRSAHKLYRRTWPPGPPASLSVPTPLPTNRPTSFGVADLLALCDPAGTRSVATDVTRFDVSHAGPGASIVPPLRIDLELSRQVGPNQTETFANTKTITLRNSL